MPAPKLKKLFEIMEISGVKVFLHWSVLLIGAVILAGAVENPFLSFTVLLSYYGLILVHECGHMLVAKSKGCTVFSVELYPLWGITRFSEPWSLRDHCLIAWAGVCAQLVVAVPLVAWVEVLGYSRFQPVNAMIAILGFLSLFVVPINLLPVPPLDGAIAWKLLPVLFKGAVTKSARRQAEGRYWR